MTTQIFDPLLRQIRVVFKSLALQNNDDGDDNTARYPHINASYNYIVG